MKKEKVKIGDEVIINCGAFRNFTGYVKKIESPFYHINIYNVKGSFYFFRNKFKLHYKEEYNIKTTLLC